MTDVLIREVPEDVVAAIEARASRLGISRSEYIRRRLAQDAGADTGAVTEGDLTWFAATFSDLNNPDVMKQAWQHQAGCR